MQGAFSPFMVEYYPNPEHDAEQLAKNELFERIIATDDDVHWRQDSAAYFTIMPYYTKGVIMVRCYGTDHSKQYLIEGKTPRQIYYKIVELGLITRMEHAAYLGKELHKAFVALHEGLYFNQDEELDFNKKIQLD